MVKTKDDFINTIIPIIERTAYGILNYAGNETAHYLKSAVPEDTEKLKDSFTYGSKGVDLPDYCYQKGASPGNPVLGLLGNAAETEDIIGPVREKYLCKVGTKVSYAIYINDGAGPHVSGEDGEGFLKRIIEWWERNGIPSGKMTKLSNGMIVDRNCEALIRHIQENGTAPVSFMDGATGVAKKSVDEASFIWKSALKNLEPLIVTVEQGKVTKK